MAKPKYHKQRPGQRVIGAKGLSTSYITAELHRRVSLWAAERGLTFVDVLRAGLELAMQQPDDVVERVRAHKIAALQARLDAVRRLSP